VWVKETTMNKIKTDILAMDMPSLYNSARQETHSGDKRDLKNAARLQKIFLPVFFFFTIVFSNAQENIVRNAGFEDYSGGLFSFWEPFISGAAVPGNGPLRAADPYEGRHSLLIALKTPLSCGVIQNVRVKPATLYRLSCEIKTSYLKAPGIGAHIGIRSTNAVSNDVSGTSDGWRKVELIVKTDPDQTTLDVMARVGTSTMPVTGSAWFDRFELEEIQDMPVFAPPGTTQPSAVPRSFIDSPLIIILIAVLSALILSIFFFLTLKKPAFLQTIKADLILAGGLTVIYAVIAFVNLGSFDAPQTYWQPAAREESVVLDFGETKPLAKMNYFLALGAGTYWVDFSSDRVRYHDKKSIGQDGIFSMIEWRSTPLAFSARYVRVRAEKPGALLGEIGFFHADTGTLVAVRTVLGTGDTIAPLDSSHICDEPGRVPDAPSYLNGMYFDETYHARTAYEYVLGRDATETSHPPLGKLTISLGVLLFGFTPFGWRFAGTFIGVLMVPLVYAFGRRIFKNRILAFSGAFLLAFDFMHFAQTRIATIDVFGVFWIMLMYYFMWRALEVNPFRARLKKLFVPLLVCGVSFGIGVASKWIALYGAVGLAVLFIGYLVYHYFIHTREYLRARKMLRQTDQNQTDEDFASAEKKVKTFAPVLVKRTISIFFFSLFVFFLIPCTIYLVSYIPFMEARGPLHPHASLLDLVIKEQTFMYSYHANIKDTHPFSSAWYEWPLMVKPIWYYTGKASLPENKVSSIAAFGNPAVWWPGIAAVIAALAAAMTLAIRAVIDFIRRRLPIDSGEIEEKPSVRKGEIKTTLFILVALAAQYIPWIIIPRKLTFIYHFFASVPFLIFAIVYVIKLLLKKYPVTKYALFVYLGIVLVLFVMFYPVLSGFVVDASYVRDFLKWFPSWYF
jgi:hypothetical protein